MFTNMRSHEMQEMHFFNQGDMHAVIAIHNLKLGPALGGCRFIEYENEADAILDAMRLAKGMSYKAALARVPQGGGKAVIMKPKGKFDFLLDGDIHFFKFFLQYSIVGTIVYTSVIID